MALTSHTENACQIMSFFGVGPTSGLPFSSVFYLLPTCFPASSQAEVFTSVVRHHKRKSPVVGIIIPRTNDHEMKVTRCTYQNMTNAPEGYNTIVVLNMS